MAIDSYRFLDFAIRQIIGVPDYGRGRRARQNASR